MEINRNQQKSKEIITIQRECAYICYLFACVGGKWSTAASVNHHWPRFNPLRIATMQLLSLNDQPSPRYSSRFFATPVRAPLLHRSPLKGDIDELMPSTLVHVRYIQLPSKHANNFEQLSRRSIVGIVSRRTTWRQVTKHCESSLA